MAKFLSMAEIEERFQSEWVLLEDPETTPMLEILRGKVVCHSKDRSEVYRTAMKLRPKSSAIFYAGPLPEDVGYLL